MLLLSREDIKKVFTIKDAIEADKIFTDLMGDDVLPRKSFIEEFAKFAEMLDV